MSPRDLVARIGRLRSRSRDERGQGVLELSIILPVVLLLLTGMVEFGLAYNDLLTGSEEHTSELQSRGLI